MKSKSPPLSLLAALFIFCLFSGCLKEPGISPPITYQGNSESAKYIIALLNQYPDNGFAALREQYGSPVWEAAYVEGNDADERYLIPLMKDERITAIVRYNLPTAEKKNLTPIVINDTYLGKTDYSDRFFSSMDTLFR